MVHWYTGTFWVVLPLISNELQLNFSQTGFLVSARSLSNSLTNLPAGAITDVIPRRRLFLGLTLVWLGLSYVGVGLATNYWVVVGALVVVGVGGGLWHPPSMTILTERFPARKGLALSIHGAGANAGDGIGPAVVGLALAVLSWREVLFVTTVPALLMALLVVAIINEPGRARGERMPLSKYFGDVKGLLRNSDFVRMTIVSGLRSTAANSFLAFLPLYLVRHFEMSTPMVGLHVSLLTLAGIISSPLLGIASDRLGRRPVLAFGLAAIAGLVLLLAFLPAGLWFTIIVAILGLFLYSMQAVMFASASDVTGRGVGATTIGIIFSANLAFSSVAPFVAGTIADSFGLISIFYFTSATSLAATLLVMTTRSRPAATVADHAPAYAKGESSER